MNNYIRKSRQFAGDLLDKYCPSLKQPIRSALINSGFMKNLNCEQAYGDNPSLISDTHNIWWDELVSRSSGSIFRSPDRESEVACEDIRRAYSPVLQHYGVDSEQFFLGSIKTEDAASLYALVRHFKPETAYQVGTFVGYSAMILAHAMKANGKGKLIAVDPEIPHRTFINPVDVARKAASSLGLEGRIEFVRGCHSVSVGDAISHRMNSSIPVVGRSTLEALGSGIDFVFIDGDHSVSATICDFMIIKDYLNEGAVIVFHDVYSWPSVAHALKVMLDDNYYYVKGTGHYFSFDTKVGWDGLAAMVCRKFPEVPTIKIKILSKDDRRAVPGATIVIPSISMTLKTDDDGSAYIYYCTIPPDSIIKVSADGYSPSLYCTALMNSSDYEEITINMERRDACQGSNKGVSSAWDFESIQVIVLSGEKSVPYSVVSLPSRNISTVTDGDGVTTIYFRPQSDSYLVAYADGYLPALKILSSSDDRASCDRSSCDRSSYDGLPCDKMAINLKPLRDSDISEPVGKYGEFLFRALILFGSAGASDSHSVPVEGVVCTQLSRNLPLQFRYFCSYPDFSSVSSLLGTYLRKVSGELILSVYRNEGRRLELLRTSVLECSSIEDNAFAAFRFEPLPDSENREYTISIEWKGGDNCDSLGLWYGFFR